MPKVVPTADSIQPLGEGGKSAAWYTAFYYLAEHFREITDGALNHKSLYALVGSKGRYINHSNPMVRKRTAGTLSRTIHTKRYAQDMREAYSKDAKVFDCAAARICAIACETRGISHSELAEWIVGVCWPDVRLGLVNEAVEWRSGLDLFRLDCEMSMLFDSCRCGAGAEAGGEDGNTEVLLSNLLHVMAFGHLDVEKARALVDGFPSDKLSSLSGDCTVGKPEYACLVRFADSTRAVLTGFWAISDDAPFVIGRYTDCQAIELSNEISRQHCRIYWEDGFWRLEDAGSRNGYRVRRDGECVPARRGDGTCDAFCLKFGDAIELPGGSCYLLVKVREGGQVELARH